MYRELSEELADAFASLNKSRLITNVNLYSRGELLVLTFLSRCAQRNEGKAVVPSDISKYTHTSSARIAIVLNALEEKGYIRREIDRADRRKILVTITEQGQQKAEDSKEAAVNHLKEVLHTMGKQDAQDFVRTFKLFLVAAEKQVVEKRASGNSAAGDGANSTIKNSTDSNSDR